MYCIKCGTKNNDNDKFCIKCGNELITTENSNNTLNKTKVNITKNKGQIKEIYSKNNKIINIIVCLIAILFVYSLINNLCFSEDVAIKKYLYAYENNDYSTLINLSDINKNEFMSNEIIERKYGKKENNKIVIKNITTNNINGEHARTVIYEKNGVSASKTLKIEKKLFGNILFNKYIITSNDFVAYSVKFVVPSNSTLYIDNVEIADKYLDSSNSDDKNNKTYKINSLLKKNVRISIKLNNSLTLTNVKTAFNDETVFCSNLSYSEIDDNNFNKISKKLNNEITSMINDALNDKEKDDDNYEYKYLRARYKNLKVTNFNIKDFELKSATIYNDTITLRLKMNYEYKDKNNMKHQKTRIVTVNLNNNLEIEKFYSSYLYSLF